MSEIISELNLIHSLTYIPMIALHAILKSTCRFFNEITSRGNHSRSPVSYSPSPTRRSISPSPGITLIKGFK